MCYFVCQCSCENLDIGMFIINSINAVIFGTPVVITPVEFQQDPQCQNTTWAIVWRGLRDPMFSRFGRTVTCAGQTDKHGAIAYTVLAKRRAVKKSSDTVSLQ